MRTKGIGAIQLIAAICILCCGAAQAQSPAGAPGTLEGHVTDPSGAAIVGATVQITAADGHTRTVTTGADGGYEVRGLARGNYRVVIASPGFAAFENNEVAVPAGQRRVLNAQLAIEAQKQQVTVQAQNPAGVSISPENNGSALVIKGKDLDALADDPDELQAELEALAGPGAGPNGGQIYIDGFTGGQLPPKSSIREIRINQNPFSAEYDRMGFGRIEIFTKPGTDKLHGEFFVSGNDDVFNTRNPFAGNEPPYHTTYYSGNISGPISKKASFFFDAERRNIGNQNVVSALTINPVTFQQESINEAIAFPETRTSISPRVDWQVTKNNTLTLRYRYVENGETNAGVGQLNLPSLGYNVSDTEQVFQMMDTQVLSPRAVNETHFQYTRDRDTQSAQNFTPTISVPGAFSSGGSASGDITDNVDTWELQNYTTIAAGKHSVKFGGRLRAYRISNQSTSNFNGAFVFSTLDAYQTAVQGIAEGLSTQEIIAMGGGAEQFAVTEGNPLATVNQFDVGLFAQDDWLLRPNMTLSFGLRYEAQNNISDHNDWAPRFTFAWGLGRAKAAPPQTVIRVGAGIFYDRFDDTYVLATERLNGFTQQRFVVPAPDFLYNDIPPVNTIAMMNASTPSISTLDPSLRAPYTIQTAVSIERQVGKRASASLTYIYSHGLHALLTRNVNAPLPGTPGSDPFDPAVRPNGVLENINQFESDGVYNQNQLLGRFNVQLGREFSLFGFYELNYANSDTASATSSPANPYNLAADYGPAAFDVRHRVFIAGTWSLPHGIRISPFFFAASGSPFNITVGQDLNGDSIFNDRPSYASAATPPANLVDTPYGAFDINPQPGETIIPPNLAFGPAQATLNLRISKTFGLGPKLKEESGAAGFGSVGAFGRGRPNRHAFQETSDRKYSLTFGIAARNIFNHVNLAPPIGTLTSPLFGISNSVVTGFQATQNANRRIDLQMRFSF